MFTKLSRNNIVILCRYLLHHKIVPNLKYNTRINKPELLSQIERYFHIAHRDNPPRVHFFPKIQAADFYFDLEKKSWSFH